MATIPEQLSNKFSNSQGKPDSNLAQDSNNLGGLPAEDFATKEYVKQYHDQKEEKQKEYIDEQDKSVLNSAKEFANALVRNQDFSSFAKLTDVQALDQKLSDDMSAGLNNQKEYTDTKIENVVNDTNENFKDVNDAIGTLNGNMNNLFQSVSDGKDKIAGAITDKGVSTSATDTFDNMASNIRKIPTTGGDIPEGYIDTSGATASESDLLLGKTAFANGNKIIGSHICTGIDTSDATATPYDILTGKTAYNSTGKVEGVLTIDESTGTPSYSIGAVEKVYGTKNNEAQSYLTSTSYDYSEFSDSAQIREKYNDNGDVTGTYLFDVDKSNNEIVIARRELTTQKFSSIQRFPISDFNLTKPGDDTLITSADTYGNEGFGGIGISRLNILSPYMVIVTYTRSKLRIYTIELKVNGNSDGNSGNITLDIENKKVSSDMEISFPSGYDGIYIYDMQTTLDGERFVLYSKYIDNYHDYVDVYIFNRNYILGADLIGFKTLIDEYNSSSSVYLKDFFIVDNNTFVCGQYIIIIKEDGTIAYCPVSGNVKAISPDATKVFIVDETIEEDTSGSGYSYIWTCKYYIETISIDYVKGNIVKEDIREIPSGILLDTELTNNNSYKKYTPNESAIFLSNNILMIKVSGERNYYSLDYDSTNILSLFKTIDESDTDTSSLIKYVKAEEVSQDEHRIYILIDKDKVRAYQTKKDFSKVIALKYLGELYYKNITQFLTATADDVREGKTFIGFNGIIETGTMVDETTENTETTENAETGGVIDE